MIPRLPALYPIVNISGTDASELERKFDFALQLGDAGATLIQLRAKALSAGALTTLAERLQAELARRDSRLIVNDRADVAAASGAAGVHLGDEDLPPKAARHLLGAQAIIGFSTHDLEDLLTVQPDSVNYIGFGPVYESPTKAGVRSARGLEALRRVCSESSVPVVAIGGVTLGSAEQVFRAGAASCAVISELENARSPRAMIAEYDRLRKLTSS
jgi:thiamine-phosphate pyrophosphorylase